MVRVTAKAQTVMQPSKPANGLMSSGEQVLVPKPANGNDCQPAQVISPDEKPATKGVPITPLAEALRSRGGGDHDHSVFKKQSPSLGLAANKNLSEKDDLEQDSEQTIGQKLFNETLVLDS